MRTPAAAAALALALSTPADARAGWFFEGSVGQGWEYKPGDARQPTNLMATVGLQLLDFLSLEAGGVASLANVEASKFDVQLRPMVELSIPAFPVYAKGIIGITGLANNPVKLQYGAGLGARFGAGGLGIFFEAAVLPTNTEAVDAVGNKSNQLIWIAEGRIGLRFG